MKIGDWSKKGNVVRFFLIDDDCEDCWGDDWNDKPYEHNAGTIYDRYIAKMIDIAFPYDWKVIEPADDWTYNGNSPYSKEDFKNRIAPFLIVVPDTEDNTWSDNDYHYYLGADNPKIWKFYFGDSEQKLNPVGRSWVKLNGNV